MAAKYTDKELDRVLSNNVFKQEANKSKKQTEQKINATFENAVNVIKEKFNNAANSNQKEQLIKELEEVSKK
jgi:hypothetical protein